MHGRILVVDDDPAIRETFQHHLEQAGHEVFLAEDGASALGDLQQTRPDMVITDIRMEPMDGLELLRKLVEVDGETVAVVMTAHEDMRSAVTAIKEGAFEYLVKPLDLEAVELLVERGLRERQLRTRARRQAEREREDLGADRLIGTAPAMIEIYKRIGALARNRAPVLIRGETGTGKERIARAIHAEGSAGEPFLAVNCTALTDTLLESELFGHVRGAFTGATSSRRGIFEVAGRGCVFLDEIGDTSPDFQAKLLRVLQDGEFLPVGAEAPRRTEARIMAATHRPLERRVAEGTFREDLYFRLRVVEITVPPLRERREDVPRLTEYFLDRIAQRLHEDPKRLSPAAAARLKSHDWPGNVRELENALLRAAVLAAGSTIREEHLALAFDVGDGPADPAAPGPALDEVVAAHVAAVLRRTGGNKRQAARLLEISRPRLDRMIERHAIELPEG